MDTKTKKRIGIAAGIALAVIIGIIIIIWLLLRGGDDASTTDTDTSTATDATSTLTQNNTTQSAFGTGETDATVVVNDEKLITSRAISFTERYGSYSSDNGFENVEALREFMTGRMSTIADSLLNQNGNANGEFYGVTTTAAQVEITDYAEGATGATVLVHTRRAETIGLADAVTTTRTARLQLQKNDQLWQVDAFQWQ